MLSNEAKRSASPAKFSQRTARNAAVADLCTLAPWDELAAFREEMRHKFEEVYGLFHERRECETRLERQYQQIDAKVERFARSTRGLHSRTEIFESHLSGQAKELDACREAHESLRDKVQRCTQELTSNLDINIQSLRVGLDEALEQRHEAVREASRRDGQSIADELLKKMSELNEQVGANMLNLEQEVVVELKQIKSDLEVQEKRLLEGLADGQSSVDQNCIRLDEKLEKLHAEFSELSEGLGTTSLQAQKDHARLVEFDSKAAKINEGLSRLEGRTSAIEQATSSKLEQLNEALDEAVDQNSASLVRIRSDLESAKRDVARALREEMREELRSNRDDACKEAQTAREEFKASIAQCRELAQSFQCESTMGLAEVKGDFSKLCSDLYGMIADVQKQTDTAHTDLRTRQDAIQQDVDARLKDLSTKVAAMKDEAQDATRSLSCAHEQLFTLTETLGGTQLRLAELGSSTGRMQTSIDEVCANATKQASFTESGLSDVRRELRAEATSNAERQECSLKNQIADLQGDWRHQFDMIRGETGELVTTFRKDLEDLAHRVGRAEQSAETQVIEIHEHLRDRLREQAHDNAKRQAVVEEELQSFIRQNDASIASLRNEVTKVASLSTESRNELERTSQRRLEEVTHNQETRFSEALSSYKDGCIEKICELRCEIQTVRASIADQAIASIGRAEQLASEIQKQTNIRADEMKRELEELESKVNEDLGNFAATARRNLQETQQETRHHIIRQLDDRLRPLSEKLNETAGECKLAKRFEGDLGHRCDRLQQSCAELGATQQNLVQQLSSTNKELSELRVELRGQIQFRQREKSLQSRDRSMDRQLLVRDELLNEEARRSPSKIEAVDEQAKSIWDGSLTYRSRTGPFKKYPDAFPSKRSSLVGPRASPPRSPRSLYTSDA